MKNKSISYSSKSAAKDLGSKRGHGNPSNMHGARGASTVKNQKSSSAGMQGLSVGQKVPMEMFSQKYQKPNRGSMTKVVDANTIKKSTKRALRGEQSKFFGL